MRIIVIGMALLVLGGIGANAQTSDVPLLLDKNLPPGMVAPKMIEMPRTGMYPPIAVRCHLVGDAVLELLVATDGSVKSAKVVKSAGYKILDDAAVNFASMLRYAPATLNGVALASRTDFNLKFDTRVQRQAYCDHYPNTFPDNMSPATKSEQDSDAPKAGN